jgi:hypothetical protein
MDDRVSDARWMEIDKAVASAVGNFVSGVEFARHPNDAADGLARLLAAAIAAFRQVIDP